MLLGSALFSILGFSAALTNFFLTCFVFLFCLFWNVKKMNKKSVKAQKKEEQIINTYCQINASNIFCGLCMNIYLVTRRKPNQCQHAVYKIVTS